MMRGVANNFRSSLSSSLLVYLLSSLLFSLFVFRDCLGAVNTMETLSPDSPASRRPLDAATQHPFRNPRCKPPPSHEWRLLTRDVSGAQGDYPSRTVEWLAVPKGKAFLDETYIRDLQIDLGDDLRDAIKRPDPRFGPEILKEADVCPDETAVSDRKRDQGAGESEPESKSKPKPKSESNSNSQPSLRKGRKGRGKGRATGQLLEDIMIEPDLSPAELQALRDVVYFEVEGGDSTPEGDLRHLQEIANRISKRTRHSLYDRVPL